jgi:hypothetical protein
MFMEPRNRFQGMNSARLCSLPGRDDIPIPTQFLAYIECLKIPALYLFTQGRGGRGVGEPVRRLEGRNTNMTDRIPSL